MYVSDSKFCQAVHATAQQSILVTEKFKQILFWHLAAKILAFLLFSKAFFNKLRSLVIFSLCFNKLKKALEMSFKLVISKVPKITLL